jgi:hypothetical protein
MRGLHRLEVSTNTTHQDGQRFADMRDELCGGHWIRSHPGDIGWSTIWPPLTPYNASILMPHIPC